MSKKKLDILYEDKELLIINKSSGFLTIRTNGGHENSLYEEASAYVKKQYPKNKVFIVNRLDKDTSGIVVFAKNERMKKYLQEHWQSCASTREYIAIVEGSVKEKKGTLRSYLVEDKTLKVHSTSSKNGKLAITHYETLAKNNNYSLLRIFIETGRKNQIRVQFSEMGHPIVGDKKYGSKKNPVRRMLLHHVFLKLQITEEKEICVVAKIPGIFQNIFSKEVKLYEKENYD